MDLLGIFVEIVALADFVTDFIVTYHLLRSRHTIWAIIAVVSMLAPLLVSSIKMIEFLREKVVKRDMNEGNF